MFLLLSMLLIIFFSVTYMVLKRSKTILLFTICFISTAVFILQLFNIFFYQNKNILLDDDVLIFLSQQNWSDVSKLNELGFEYQDDIGYVAHYDSENYLCSVVIEIQEEDYSLLKRKFRNISYEAYENKMSLFDINRLFIKKKSVIRRCHVRINNIEIRILEDNVEKSPIAFQDFFRNLSNVKT